MPPVDLPFYSVSWKVNTRCNYRCTYCLQPSFDEPYPRDIEATVASISEQLGRPYEVKIAGGEVVADAGKALRLVRAIARDGHWLSMCTNFSAPLDVYKQLVDAMAGRFYHIQCSLHLEHADPAAFLARCKALSAYLPGHAKLVVNNVIRRGVDHIRALGELKRRFEAEGLTFYTDQLVDVHGRYLDYDAVELAAIEAELGAERRLFTSRGASCRAGHSYFILLPDLEAWKCWDGYLRNDRAMYLGSMRTRSFALADSIAICPYDTCSCPTPMIKHQFKLAGAPAVRRLPIVVA
jgi:MoaA/NifB/PqqE/SkfB family radical SAM enzyme